MGTLTIEEGIEVISESAFVEEGQLRHLNLPSTLESIGKHAFLFSMLGRDNLEIRCLGVGRRMVGSDGSIMGRAEVSGGRVDDIRLTGRTSERSMLS